MTGGLLAAVTDEWERGKVIAERAGIDSRTAGPRLASLERQGLVVSSMNRKARVALYRRGPNAPPVDAAPAPELILRDLRGKLAEMELHDSTSDPHDEGYMAARHEIVAWLDERGAPAAPGRPSPHAYRQATGAREWEVAARRQAARADQLERALHRVLEVVEFVDSNAVDILDDRLRCEQNDCQARGWLADGFVGTKELAWCPRHAPGQRGGA
jgi:hypothetical protein